jgi:2-iminobutanoate/2-iminopropanoate deaminase
MSAKRCFSPDASPKAVGPYNHGVQIGNLLYTAGQVPLDPATGKLVDGGIAEQTERVLDNIEIILQSEGLSFAHVVKTTIFMTDLGEFSYVNEIYAKRFELDFPVRSTVQVAALPLGASIEIEVVAHY